MDYIKQVVDTLWKDSILHGIFYLSLLVILTSKVKSWKKMTYAWYSVIVIPCLLNPITVKITNKIWGVSVAYHCRLFSMIPIVFVIAYAFIILVDKLTGKIKMVTVIGVIAFLMVCGDYMYSNPWFVKAQNQEKIPSDVMEISKLLSGYEDVTIAASYSFSPYIRMYDAGIHMITGRGTSDRIGYELSLEYPDVEYIMQKAASEGCQFVIVNKSEGAHDAFDRMGYEVWSETSNTYIYQVSGYPYIVKYYNDKEQVERIMYYDSEGNPVIGSKGYSSIRYEYNRYNQIIAEYYYDENNNPMTISTLNNYGMLYEYTYNGYKIKETYIDKIDNPMMTVMGYASVEYSYNSDNRISAIVYKDECDNVCCNKYGIAIEKRTYNALGNITVYKFYDMYEKGIKNTDGYATLLQKYDQNNRLIERKYLDEFDKEVENIWGYSLETREYDSSGALINTSRYDSAGMIIN